MIIVIRRTSAKPRRTLDRNQNVVERPFRRRNNDTWAVVPCRDKYVHDGYSAGTNEKLGGIMNKLAIGDVVITSIIERDGPWRRPPAALRPWLIEQKMERSEQ
jgi:hypothetical protein